MHRLTKDEAAHYLRTRAEQGFNTVLTVALAEFDGLDEPNAEGHLPFVDADPRRPVAAYWEHVDWCLATAAGLGLTVGLLPTWGCHWRDPDPRRGTVTFDAGRALDYARWLRDRYRDADLIWVLGGDRMPGTAEQRRVIEAFAEGVRGDQLITYHPGGRASSSEAFPGRRVARFRPDPVRAHRLDDAERRLHRAGVRPRACARSSTANRTTRTIR